MTVDDAEKEEFMAAFGIKTPFRDKIDQSCTIPVEDGPFL